MAPEESARQVDIRLFGGLDIRLNGSPLAGSVTRKAKSLLAYLAVEADGSQRRQALAEMFWPDKPRGTARNNLRQALLALRSALADGASDRPFLLPTVEAIQFNLDSPFYLDTRQFEQLIQASKNHNHKLLQDCARCEDRLRRAVDCYRDDFLVDASLPDLPDFDGWVAIKRETYRRQASRALRTLISIHSRRNEHREASQLGRRLVALEPWVEASHRILMRAFAQAGMRSAALKQYKVCRRMLAAEFGADPSQETTELYDAIRHGQLAPVDAGPAAQVPMPAAVGANSQATRGWLGGGAAPRQWGELLALLGLGGLVLIGATQILTARRQDTDTAAAGATPRTGARIVASFEGDWMWFDGIGPGSTLSISIYASDDRRQELWHGTVIANRETMMEGSGIINVFPWDHGVDMVPGNVIVLSTGGAEKTLRLEQTTIDVFDVTADRIAGTAPPGRYVQVVAGFGPDSEEQNAIGVTSDARTGQWTVDFASLGIDIKDDWRNWSHADIYDEDGDINEASAIYAPTP